MFGLGRADQRANVHSGDIIEAGLKASITGTEWQKERAKQCAFQPGSFRLHFVASAEVRNGVAYEGIAHGLLMSGSIQDQLLGLFAIPALAFRMEQIAALHGVLVDVYRDSGFYRI